MRERFGRNLGEVMVAVAVLIVALHSFGFAAERTSFHGDETQNISRAPYFSYLFLQRDVTRTEWGDNPRTHTHPMLTRYLIGGSLWATATT